MRKKEMVSKEYVEEAKNRAIAVSLICSAIISLIMVVMIFVGNGFNIAEWKCSNYSDYNEIDIGFSSGFPLAAKNCIIATIDNQTIVDGDCYDRAIEKACKEWVLVKREAG